MFSGIGDCLGPDGGDGVMGRFVVQGFKKIWALLLAVIVLLFFRLVIVHTKGEGAELCKVGFTAILPILLLVILFVVAHLIYDAFSSPVRNRIAPFLFVGPAFLIAVIFFIIPLLVTFYLSFHDYQGHFVFLDNYLKAFGDPIFWTALINTVLWSLFAPFFSVFFGLLFAFVAERSRFEWIGRTFILSSFVFSGVSAALMWQLIVYNDHQGLFYALLQMLGVNSFMWTSVPPVMWTFLLSLVLVWIQSGYSMVLFSGAIKSVPDQVISAARIDGASEFSIFLHIIIPSIKNSVITAWIAVAFLTVKVFDIVWVISGGRFGTEVMGTLFYREAFQRVNLTGASVYAVILMLFVLPLGLFTARKLAQRNLNPGEKRGLYERRA